MTWFIERISAAVDRLAMAVRRLAKPLPGVLALVFMVATAAHAAPPGIVLNGTVGTPFSQTPAYIGASSPYNSVASFGTPPPGISVASNGAVSGMPTTPGTYTFTVSGTGIGGDFSNGVSFTIAAAPTPPATPAPTVANGSITTAFNTPGTLDVAPLVSGTYTSVTGTTQPANGSAAVSGTVMTYTPHTGFSGTDSFNYEAIGPGGASAPATITITVQPAPLPPAPTAAARAVSVPFNSPGVVIDLTSSIGGSVTSIAAGAPAHGTVAISGLKATYTPTAGFAGADSFTYKATGPGGTSAAATVSITVQGLPDPTQDADVNGLISAEGDAVNHFTDLQVSDINNHLEGLHDGTTGGGSGNGVGFSFSPDGATALSAGREPGVGPPVTGMGDGGGSITVASVLRANSQGASTSGPVAFWTMGGVNFGRTSGSSLQAATTSTTIGLTSGLDFTINPTLTAGAGVGYNQDQAKVGSNGSQARSQGYFGIGYASYRPMQGVFIDGQGGYGGLHFDSTRYIGASGGLASGSRNGSAWFGSVTIGAEQRQGDLQWAPYARLSAMNGTLDGFTETGGGVYNLSYSSQKLSNSVLSVGLRASEAFKLDDGVLTPRARIEYLGALSSSDQELMTYPAWTGSPVYALSENLVDRSQTVMAVGAVYVLKGGISVSADFSGTVQYNSRSSQQLIFGFKAPF